ncbi:hypothetical protein AURDEDRAFT_161496 [Auricularia subglabra TFB-10046 SS5]|nr:hypothetical protein AURDEDRAFT_161496 [Auricularia subglabra TFB-10046 SS5]
MSAWRLLVNLLPAPHQLKQLTLAFELEEDIHTLLAEQQRPLTCPNLRNLTLAAVGNPVIIALEDAECIILECLSAPVPVALILQNVWARGWDEWAESSDLVSSVNLRGCSDLYPKTPWHL